MIAAKRTRLMSSGASHEDMANWAFSWGLPLSGAPWAWNGSALFTKQAAQASLASIGMMEHALTAWRSWVDASQAAFRAQQDIVLQACGSQPKQAAETRSETVGAAPATGLLSPVIAAAKACEQVGEAVLEVQRGALEALSNSQRPH